MKSEKTHQSINAILLDAYYRDMWCEFSNIDTLYEDYTIHLIGTKGLNMLRDNGMGILTIVENPSVVDFIKCNNMIGAMTRYRELHNCKAKDAYDAVYAMKRDMHRINKKNDKEEK